MYEYRKRTYSVGSSSAEQVLNGIINDCKLNKVSQQQTRDKPILQGLRVSIRSKESGQAHRKESNIG